VRPEGFGKLKKKKIIRLIESQTFLLVAQRLDHYAISLRTSHVAYSKTVASSLYSKDWKQLNLYVLFA
jgi:hypothetical protein